MGNIIVEPERTVDGPKDGEENEATVLDLITDTIALFKGLEVSEDPKETTKSPIIYEERVAAMDVSTIRRTKLIDCLKSSRIGCYTASYSFVSLKRKIHLNMYGLKCLRNSPTCCKWDVFRGYESDINWSRMDHSLNSLLEWIWHNKRRICKKSEKPSINSIDVDFVCMRGALHGIMDLPFLTARQRSDWGMGAVKIGRTIYLTLGTIENHTGKGMDDKLTYSGHKFEQYMTYPAYENRRNDLKCGVVNDFCCVYLNKSTSHSVLYAGKIDCIDAQTVDCRLEDMRFMELKIMKTPSYRDKYFEERIALRARSLWNKAVLSDIDAVQVGLRKQLRFVERIIPNVSRDELLVFDKTWSPYQCINAVDSFLLSAKEHITEEKVCYLMRFIPGNQSTVVFYRTKYPVKAFLPDWFVEEKGPK